MQKDEKVLFLLAVLFVVILLGIALGKKDNLKTGQDPYNNKKITITIETI